jgi:phosphate-selective porin OprO/OprP
LERTESSKSIKFLELAGTTEAFAPGRNLGFEYATWGKNTYWGAGLFGDSDLNNTKGGDEGFGLTTRFVYAPVNETGKIFHIGAAATYREADAAGFGDDGKELDKTIRYRNRAATHVEGRRFIDAKVGMAESQFKYGAELLAATGSVSLQGEYIGANVSRKSGLEDYNAKGWYAQVGWLMKGGDYKYKMKSARLAKPGPGALEFILRYNQTDLNDTDAAILGGEQKDISLGCIYYINHNMLVKFNYANVDLDKNAFNGEENFNLLQARFQIAF